MWQSSPKKHVATFSAMSSKSPRIQKLSSLSSLHVRNFPALHWKHEGPLGQWDFRCGSFAILKSSTVGRGEVTNSKPPPKKNLWRDNLKPRSLGKVLEIFGQDREIKTRSDLIPKGNHRPISLWKVLTPLPSSAAHCFLPKWPNVSFESHPSPVGFSDNEPLIELLFFWRWSLLGAFLGW